MNLEEFVALTLVQIRRGVNNANVAMSADPQKPAKLFWLPQPAGEKDRIEFDVAVTVTLSAEGAAHGKAGIKVVEGGVEGRIEGSREHVSRVRFSVMTSAI